MTVVLLTLVAILAVVVYDVTQRRHAILRNFPLVGHFRYWLEAIGPELRQYIVTSNDEERPFSRDQRRWVYSSAKRQNNYFGFGTDNDLERSSGYLVVKHSTFPLDTPHAGEPGFDPLHPLPAAKRLGAGRGRARAFRPASIVNVSAMSFGSLSAAAVEAINRGAALSGCWQNTGEGGVSPYHRHGGDLVWQIGTGYFGCRADDGGFSPERFRDTLAANPAVRAIEVKLSQGAKPGHGGVLPKAKITREISRIRGIPMGRDCLSPARHAEFDDVDGLLDFVERLAELSGGLPVGIKSAVGELRLWQQLARLMRETGRGVDFVTIDGGEGGTGAAPKVFADHVSLPFKVAFSRVYPIFVEEGLADDVVFIGAGKLGFPETALLAFALGCDVIQVAREAMLAVGCIQAQRCHTGHCPTGVATQNRWLMRGLDPTDKAARLANYLVALRRELLELAHACGKRHPAFVDLDDLEVLDDRFGSTGARQLFHYGIGWGVPSDAAVAQAEKKESAETANESAWIPRTGSS